MDSNQDGIISSKDFKSWLFPQNNGDNHEFLVRYLTKVVEERFHGNVRVMFNSFKTYVLRLLFVLTYSLVPYPPILPCLCVGMAWIAFLVQISLRE